MSLRLVFVYAIDGDVVSSVINYAHKMISPGTYKCRLCALTYGPFGTRKEWTAFATSLRYPADFLHRNEFAAQFPEVKERLPAVFLQDGSGLRLLIDAEAMERCQDIQSLMDLVRDRVGDEHATKEPPTPRART